MKKIKRPGKTSKRKNIGRDASLREHLAYLLRGGGAHVHFDDALQRFPANKRGAFAKGFPHTAWQLLEHGRLVQWDILEFSRNPKHVSPEFPEGYWPKTPLPPSNAAWEKSVRTFRKGSAEMIRLVKNPRTDLLATIPGSQGLTILREALLLADHNSYHLGQLVALRRALGIWPDV